MARRKKDKYEVDQDLLRSLEDTPEEYEAYDDEYEYEEKALTKGRIRWAWLFLFLALGILIVALVFQLTSHKQDAGGASAHHDPVNDLCA